MNAEVKVARALALTKPDPTTSALIALDHNLIGIKPGVRLAGRAFDHDGPRAAIDASAAGTDFVVGLDAEGQVEVQAADEPREPGFALIGGFHFAPGGNAGARLGGTDQPAINPYSIWDVNFRPACPEPGGMTLVEVGGRKVWVDIYLLNAEHLTRGTSAFAAPIADGSTPPANPGGGRYPKLDYETARAVMAHHGKSLLGLEEFFAAAYGVTEKTEAPDEPELTGLDTARTSKFGLMQATGNMWVWGHDGDPDNPRASLFGGSWLHDGHAGSRYAHVGYWPGHSNDNVGARGRSDHLQLE